MIKTFRNIFGFTDTEIDTCVKNRSLLSLEIELGSKCNLRCVYCYSGEDLFRRDEMEIEEIFDSISQAKAMGAKKIVYLGAGEPLLDPKLPNIIKYVHKLKLDHILFTNATLIDLKTANFFYEHNLTVVVTYNSMNPEIYDWLSGLSGAYRSMKHGMDYLFEAGYPDKDHVLGIESVICRQNYKEIPDIWRWARDNNILPYIECITHKGLANERKDLFVDKETTRSVFEELARIDAEEYNLYWQPHPPIAGFPCKRNLYSCLINSQGFVLPCVGVDIKMGNIRDKSLSDILKNSTPRQELLGIHENIKGHCRMCEFNTDCYGCRGTAYNLTGDYLASDPTCWRIK